MNTDKLQELQRLYELYLKEYNSQDAWSAARMHLQGIDHTLYLNKKPIVKGCCE